MAEITLDMLNESVRCGKEALIREEELLYHFRIRGVAEYIKEQEKIRIVLLAGPSGSGKTTTANILKDNIVSLGEEAIVVSLDDFYRDADDGKYPKAKDGERNYECPEALHLSEIAEALKKIAGGESFALPKYDFKLGKRISVTQHQPMTNGCVIIEGLHALNPAIYSSVPKESLYRMFVSVSTNINDGGKRILSGRKIRFVRRMVRDSIYRGADAKRTLDMWQDVLASEDVYLYPYKNTADLALDTFHMFEPSVMRDYALALIDEELAGSSAYVRVVRDALTKITPIAPSLVPESSLIKEFIPGGVYEELY